jgi:hypothetical protein
MGNKAKDKAAKRKTRDGARSQAKSMKSSDMMSDVGDLREDQWEAGTQTEPEFKAEVKADKKPNTAGDDFAEILAGSLGNRFSDKAWDEDSENLKLQDELGSMREEKEVIQKSAQALESQNAISMLNVYCSIIKHLTTMNGRLQAFLNIHQKPKEERETKLENEVAQAKKDLKTAQSKLQNGLAQVEKDLKAAESKLSQYESTAERQKLHAQVLEALMNKPSELIDYHERFKPSEINPAYARNVLENITDGIVKALKTYRTNTTGAFDAAMFL